MSMTGHHRQAKVGERQGLHHGTSQLLGMKGPRGSLMLTEDCRIVCDPAMAARHPQLNILGRAKQNEHRVEAEDSPTTQPKQRCPQVPRRKQLNPLGGTKGGHKKPFANKRNSAHIDICSKLLPAIYTLYFFHPHDCLNSALSQLCSCPPSASLVA